METIYYVAVIVVAAVSMILGWFFVKRTNTTKDVPPIVVLPPGWQFYSKPTTLEPPGTVFRIDSDKKRYIVDVLKIKTQKGEEVFGKLRRGIEANAGILVRFLGLKDVGVSSGAKKSEQLVLELQDLVREVSTDVDLDKTLKPFLGRLDYKIDNRYFIIREATTVKEINFQLTQDQVNDLGGWASLKKVLSLRGKLFYSKQGRYVLQERFDKPMRVMFLPDEIKIVSSKLGGAGPELGRVRVENVLEWE